MVRIRDGGEGKGGARGKMSDGKRERRKVDRGIERKTGGRETKMTGKGNEEQEKEKVEERQKQHRGKRRQ